MTDTAMSNGQELARRFEAFNDELIAFVEGCSDADWGKITPAERWPVGVTAHHVAVGHYPLIAWVQLIVDGQPLPGVTMDLVDQANAQHAEEFANCTQVEVVELLTTDGSKARDFVAGLSDEDLAREDYLKLFDTTISAGALYDALLIDYANRHFESMKAAVS